MNLHWFIIAVCFYDVLVAMLLPSTAIFILASDGSMARYIVNISAMSIGLWVLCKEGFRPLTNYWIAGLVLFMVFSAAHSPDIKFESAFTPKDSGLFNFKPMFESLVFLLMFCGVQSMAITQENIKKILKTIVLTAVVYSVYILVQRAGFDQIYKLVTPDTNTLSRNFELGGFISQPVFAACFLSMLLPFVIKSRNYFFIALVVGAIILTGNRTAMIASGFVGLALCPKTRNFIYLILGAYVLAIVGSFIASLFGITPLLHDTGRFGTWLMVLKDIAHPIFPGVDKFNILTGQGIGAFSTLFPFYHNSGWLQAHNEFLEMFYGMSFIGLGLFILAIYKVLASIYDRYVLAALIAILVCSMTNPVWHIPQIQFMTVLLMGIGLNKEKICIS